MYEIFVINHMSLLKLNNFNYEHVQVLFVCQLEQLMLIQVHVLPFLGILFVQSVSIIHNFVKSGHVIILKIFYFVASYIKIKD